VFWIVDRGASPHRSTVALRVQGRYPHAVAVHLPVHASWLNQLEISCAMVARKAVTPNDLAGREAARGRLLGFESRDNHTAKPFNWQFTRAQLKGHFRSLDYTTNGLMKRTTSGL